MQKQHWQEEEAEVPYFEAQMGLQNSYLVLAELDCFDEEEPEVTQETSQRFPYSDFALHSLMDAIEELRVDLIEMVVDLQKGLEEARLDC